MPIDTVKSAQIIAIEAGRSTEPASSANGGKVRRAGVTTPIAAGSLEVGDIWKLVRIPSNASIVSIRVFNDDLDSNGSPTLAADLGLYAVNKITDGSNTYAAGAVILAAAYASAITTFQAANILGVEVAYEQRDIIKIGQKVWQDAGLAADPQTDLDIAFTLTGAAATAAAGDVSLEVLYSVE